MEDDTAMIGLRALLGEGLTTPAPVEEPKIRVEDKTVISFTDVEEWKAAAEERGLQVINRGENGEDEFFAQEEDITMIGYFKDDWGMLVCENPNV